MIKYGLVALLALHGLVHELGFAATWKFGPAAAVSAKPSLMPGITAGGAPAHVLGAVWLIALLAFVAAAFGVLTDSSWWRIVAAAAAVISLGVCIAWWSDAKAGAAIDIGILIVLAVSALAIPAAAAGATA
jgi:hypothetical protein